MKKFANSIRYVTLERNLFSNPLYMEKQKKHSKKTLKNYQEKPKAFTLVELIIVITILSILSVIAFLWMKDYSKNSRDTNRLATFKTLEKGLDLFALKTGNYPEPEWNVVELLWSGNTLLLKKWELQDTISRQIQANKTSQDPLSNHYYAYAITENKQEYQLSTFLEEDIISYENMLFPKVYANNNYKAYVIWNYRPKIFEANGVSYLIPSLIFSYSGTITENKLEVSTQNSQNIFYVVNKENNLPYAVNGNTPINNTQTNNLNYIKELEGKLPEWNGTLIQDLIIWKTTTDLTQEEKWIIKNIISSPSQKSENVVFQKCITETIDDYILWETIHGNNYNAEKQTNISNGVQVYRQIFTCNYGNFEKNGDEILPSPNCNENYVANGWSCVPDTCTWERPEHSELNGTQGTASWSWSQNNTWLCKYKCNDWYETSTCIAKTKNITTANYNGRDFSFESFTLAYNSPQVKSSQSLSIAWWTSVLTTNFMLDLDGETVHISEQQEVVTCNTNYTLSWWSCVADTRNQACVWKPTNSAYNSATSISQSWNGTVWLPSTTAVWNTTASTTECRYTCNAWFTHQSWACNDITAPTGWNFTINSWASTTNTATVTLNITCPTNVSTPIQVAYGNTANPTNWGNCTTGNISHTLTNWDGAKTVYVRFRDSASIPNITGDISKGISLNSSWYCNVPLWNTFSYNWLTFTKINQMSAINKDLTILPVWWNPHNNHFYWVNITNWIYRYIWIQYDTINAQNNLTCPWERIIQWAIVCPANTKNTWTWASPNCTNFNTSNFIAACNKTNRWSVVWTDPNNHWGNINNWWFCFSKNNIKIVYNKIWTLAQWNCVNSTTTYTVDEIYGSWDWWTNWYKIPNNNGRVCWSTLGMTNWLTLWDFNWPWYSYWTYWSNNINDRVIWNIHWLYSWKIPLYIHYTDWLNASLNWNSNYVDADWIY